MSPSNPHDRIEAGREAGLLISAQSGNLDCFLELVREHQREIYRLCFALTCEPEAASRLAHETAHLAWRDLQRLRVGRPFFPFVARIARNLAIAHARGQAGFRPEPPSRRPSGKAWGGATGNPALAAEELRLFTMFESLPTDDRIVLALRVIEGLTCAQIAAALGQPVGAVMHRLHALRGRLEEASQRRVA